MEDLSPEQRLEERARAWDVMVERRLETASSIVAFGRRGDRAVVLKIVRSPGDEWRSGRVLRAFDGRGTVRPLASVDGAVLLERLDPATSLAALALAGGDREATEIVSEVIAEMGQPDDAEGEFATVERWGRGFERYLERGDDQIPRDLVEQGGALYAGLCATQTRVGLLHGDMQHYNVLFDARRGWVAIDPKGVVGELEYELGASLRNPCERPEVFASAAAVERRIASLAGKLRLNADRALAWAFSQAVLSAIWSVEDGERVDPGSASLLLAGVIREML